MAGTDTGTDDDDAMLRGLLERGSTLIGKPFKRVNFGLDIVTSIIQQISMALSPLAILTKNKAAHSSHYKGVGYGTCRSWLQRKAYASHQT